MVDLVIRLNGEPAEWRSFTEAEEAPLLKQKEAARAWDKELKEQGRTLKGMTLNLGRAFRAFLLERPKPGDDITADAIPEGYEEVWVRFQLHDSETKGNMRIAP